MNTTKSGFVAPLLLILVAILLVGGGAYVFQSTQTNPQTADWKTYESDTYNYSFKYPEGWSVQINKDGGVTLNQSQSEGRAYFTVSISYDHIKAPEGGKPSVATIASGDNVGTTTSSQITLDGQMVRRVINQENYEYYISPINKKLYPSPKITTNIYFSTSWKEKSTYKEDMRIQFSPALPVFDQILSTFKFTSTPNADVVAEWKALSSDELSAVLSKENMEPLTDIQLSTTTDLTGDGITEGVFVGFGANHNTAFIMMRGSNGKNVAAKQKYKDGSIYPVELLYLGRALVAEDWKLLPDEHGFYTKSSSFDMASNKFKCNPDGVKAYSWNASTSMFEWNQALTAKYTAQVCK